MLTGVPARMGRSTAATAIRFLTTVERGPRWTTPAVEKTVPIEELIEKYTRLRWDNTVTAEDPTVCRIRDGILAGERASLASAITLVESKNPRKRAQGNILLKEILRLEHKRYAEKGRDAMIFRIGISGSPGVGKSSFIEALGQELTEKRNMKTAVLTIDPSSAITGGSILGDLTRMQNLSRNPKAYIRQSPTSGSLGGVTRGIHEAIILCEGAGYEVVIIETVGVGQSEIAVADMCDMFCLLLSPAHGDELQGVKRGIMEISDLLVVTKDDGDLKPKAKLTQAEYISALKYMRPKSKVWSPRVLRSSIHDEESVSFVAENMFEFWNTIGECGELESKRHAQLSKMSTTRFGCDYAKRVAGCKKCKLQLQKGELRLSKITPNPFVQNADGPPPDMKQYFHAECLFEMFYKARASTKVIEEEGDIEDWETMKDEDKEKVSKLIEDLVEQRAVKGTPKAKTPKTPKAKTPKATSDDEDEVASTPKRPPPKQKKAEEEKEKPKKAKEEPKKVEKKDGSTDAPDSPSEDQDKGNKDPESSKFNSFVKFCKLCDVIASVSKHGDKAAAVKMYIDKAGDDCDVYVLMKLLLPGVDQRVYNMKEKQLLHHFAEIYDLDHEDLVNAYKANGDASDVIRKALEKKGLAHTQKSDWSIMKIDRWLDKLTEMTTDEKQIYHIKFATKRLSPLEIMYLVRLIKKDLRINAGGKHILEGLHPSAYDAFKSCRDLKEIVKRCQSGTLKNDELEIGIKLGTPVLPMLAEACKSVEYALKKCPNGMLAEIKYDGERVQVHKNGDEFSFFSRSQKPVQKHKVEPFEEFIPKAFSNGANLILDAEVLMVDTHTGKPLPFGTLGVHKKTKFQDACVCLFVFDILRYNNEDLTDKPLVERKQILEKNMTEVPNRVMFSNYFVIEKNDHTKLNTLIMKAIDEGLEGLVLKDRKSIYEPGRRHWLKMKKDYLEEGSMADTADLLVLGAYFGTGSKGGMMSVFLMGVRDAGSKNYRTVTKCGNGYTDDQLEKINKDLSKHMKRIDRSYDNVPSWLRCSRPLVPDFVIDDPKNAPVWEITGAEFSKSDNHTADGISIRFPRMTRMRNDKDWETATNLEELKKLVQQSAIVDEEKEDETPLYAKGPTGPKHVLKKTKQFGDVSDDEEEEGKVPKKKETKKRKPSDEEEEGSSKKQKKAKKRSDEEDESEDECPSDMEPCKYGKDCYRKNPDHKKQFWHPKK